jgi:hypothetical protein
VGWGAEQVAPRGLKSGKLERGAEPSSGELTLTTFSPREKDFGAIDRLIPHALICAVAPRRMK